MTVPPRRWAAAVNEHCVRVLGSKNISAMTLPRSIEVRSLSQRVDTLRSWARLKSLWRTSFRRLSTVMKLDL